MKRLKILQNLVYEKFYTHEKILRTRNCRCRYIKTLLPEKRKENMQTKQPPFKSRLNYVIYTLKQVSVTPCIQLAVVWFLEVTVTS